MASDLTFPVSGHRPPSLEMRRGCTGFLLLVAILSAANGTLLLIGRERAGRSVLLFSGAVWLCWTALHLWNRAAERARIATPAGHVRLGAEDISVPFLSGDVKTLRWSDLQELRMTRDIDGTIDYEFYAGEEHPSIALDRSRVKDSATLDRELAARAPRFNQTFEWERPATVRAESPVEVPPGERFNINLPATGWHTLRGFAGLVVMIAVVIALSLRFPDAAMKWFMSGAGFVIMIAALLLGIFLATRSRKAWLVCAADALYIRAPGKRLPALIRWSDLRDFTLVSSGRRHPTQTLTLWTAEGSWKLERIRISRPDAFLLMLQQRSARKPISFRERKIGAESTIERRIRQLSLN